jgi:DNA-binding XRE family transcriptional regulator
MAITHKVTKTTVVQLENGAYGVEFEFDCESASNFDPTPIEHQIIEAEAELPISSVFNRRPIVTPSFFSKFV